jgi:hypothetical protein
MNVQGRAALASVVAQAAIVFALAPSIAGAQQPPPSPLVEGGSGAPRPAHLDAEQTVRDGNFLPMTISPRVGNHYVAAQIVAGYDTAHNDVATSGGPAGSLWVEGALFNFVALRVGADYLSGSGQAAPWGGVRIGILRQERYGLDLGLAVFYKNVGFSERTGELELIVSAARRWGRVALLGNLAYGQGLDKLGWNSSRDVEGRLALLVNVHQRVNVGLDSRFRADIGTPNPDAAPSLDEADFDFVAGPVLAVSLGPIALLAHGGVHTVIAGDSNVTGVIATGGLGGSF